MLDYCLLRDYSGGQWDNCFQFVEAEAGWQQSGCCGNSTDNSVPGKVHMAIDKESTTHLKQKRIWLFRMERIAQTHSALPATPQRLSANLARTPPTPPRLPPPHPSLRHSHRWHTPSPTPRITLKAPPCPSHRGHLCEDRPPWVL